MKLRRWKTYTAAILALALLLPLAACGGDQEDEPVVSVPVILEDPVTEGELGIAFRQGDVLRDQVWAALQVLKADGTVGEISTSWFGSDVTTIPADETATESLGEVASRTFIMGLTSGYPPMGYHDGEGNLVGFDIDLAGAVCSYYGWTLDIMLIDWDAKEMELDSGNVDCIWNGMTLTDGRRAQMDCTDAYMAGDQVLLVMSGNEYSRLADLKNKTVAVRTSSAAELALAENTDFRDSLEEVKMYDSTAECLEDLEAGRIDAVLLDRVAAEYYVANRDTGVFAAKE